MQVTPRCKMARVLPYISAQGHLFPCCWIANEDFLSEMKTWLGDDVFAQLDTKTYEINDIWQSEAMRRLESSWTDGSFRGCVFFCGKPFDENEPLARDNHLSIDLGNMKIEEW